MARGSVRVKPHRRRGNGKTRIYVRGYCRRPPNRAVRPYSKRYKEMPF